MCHYLSFLVDKKGNFYFGYLDSHAEIEEGHNLKPGSYREAEWVGETPGSLSVRVEDGEHESFYRALVLGLYKTRSALEKSITSGKAGYTVISYKNGKVHSAKGPAIVHPTYKEYYKNGKLHRDRGPAVVCMNGHKEYWKGGVRHRSRGPAIIYSAGQKAYWRKGQYIKSVD